MGPIFSGSLFSLATKVQPKGEALAFGIFAAVSLVGFLLSLEIRSPNLEAEGWNSGGEEDTSDKSDDEEQS